MSIAGTMALVDTAFDDDAIARCSATIREHSKSFSMASRLLPQPARDEAVVLYAWCRYADDAVDEAPPGMAGAALARLEAELDSIYAGEPQSDPVLAAFQQLVQRRNIPKLYPAELVAGMRMDVEDTRYPDEETLLLYCYRVASTVGLMMCHIMGLRRTDALHQAAHLGVAMQITNICRDVAEDWGRGRRYLPADLVVREGLRPAPEAPVGGAELPDVTLRPFARVIVALLDRADGFYRSAHGGFMALPWQSALACEAAGRIYRDIGRVIAAQDHDPSAGRAWTTKGRKLWLAARALASTAAGIPRRIWLRLRGRGIAPPTTVLSFADMNRLGALPLPPPTDRELDR